MDPVLFPLAPAGAQRETVAYSTDVLQAYGGSEQRIQRRGVQDLSLGFRYVADGAAEAPLALRLLDADPETGYLVPWWPYATPLGAAAALGASRLTVDLADVPTFAQGGERLFLLWASATSWEQVTAAAVDGSGVDLAAPLAAGWRARTALLPLLRAYPTERMGADRLNPALRMGDVVFAADLLDGAQLPAGSELYLPAGYLGLDVLTGLWDGGGPQKQDYVRRTTFVTAEAGAAVYDSQDALGGLTRDLLFKLEGRSEVAALRRFHAARLGALKPFWLPTWDQDLTLAAPASQGAGAIDVLSSEVDGYHVLGFPVGYARRHLQLWTWGHEPVYLEVGGVEYQGEGVCTLELLGTLPEAITTAWRVSFLRHTRLADDALELDWAHPGYAAATLRTLELASDCPTGAA